MKNVGNNVMKKEDDARFVVKMVIVVEDKIILLGMEIVRFEEY